MDTTTHFIAFYKYLDTDVWQRTGVKSVSADLTTYTNTIDYIDPESIVIVPVELPNIIKRNYDTKIQ